MPPRFPVRAGLLLLVSLAASAGHLPAQPSDPVAISATAAPDYEQQKFGPHATKPESYVFFQGQFYGGTTRDPDLENAQFNQIAQVLATNLVRQNYFPTKDTKNADLLLVVHWGTTTVYVNPNMQDDQARLNQMLAQYNAAAAKGKGDPGPLNAELQLVDAERAQTMRQIGINAQLLGFNDQIMKDRASGTASSTGISTDESSLLQSLAEERYFVILMAYDYRSMKPGAKPKLLWSTRFSIRAPGNTFTAALPVMSKAASDYFGRVTDGLKIQKPLPVPEGKVEVGEPKVVGEGK